MRELARTLLRRARPPAGPLTAGPPGGLLEHARSGALPLRPGGAEAAEQERLSVAVVVPSFRRGSGGHSTIANLLRGLEAAGHGCSVWVADDEGRHAGESAEEVEALFEDFFGPLQGPVRSGFDGWRGADVVMATGWQTVFRVLRLPGAKARAYLVQDHEPEFYATSAERVWAEATYRLGLHCIAASPWLAGLLRARHRANATHFDLGVDHAVYRPQPGVTRRGNLVCLYARAVTPRRAVPLGLAALEELQRRRQDLDLVLFGDATPVRAPFPHRHVGVLEPEGLARLYAEATVGVVLSMTNPSLLPTEMMACGLPCVDIDADPMRETFGADGPVELAPFLPLGLAASIENLLGDAALRERRRAAGLELAAARTWPAAAAQVEEGLREALRRATGGR